VVAVEPQHKALLPVAVVLVMQTTTMVVLQQVKVQLQILVLVVVAQIILEQAALAVQASLYLEYLTMSGQHSQVA
jgi:hypothetical protein